MNNNNQNQQTEQQTEMFLDGTRYVKYQGTQDAPEWFPDTITEDGMTFILDERYNRFQYYPIGENLKKEDITDEMRQKVLNEVYEAEQNQVDEDVLTVWEDEEEERAYHLNGMYATARLEYLQNNKPELYEQMKADNTLEEHLIAINKKAEEYEEELVSIWARHDKTDEQLKATDQMEWIRRMNSYKMSAQEAAFEMIVYI